MAHHSSILVWEIPWTEELGGLQSTESQRVRHDLATRQQQQHQILLYIMLIIFIYMTYYIYDIYMTLYK